MKPLDDESRYGLGDGLRLQRVLLVAGDGALSFRNGHEPESEEREPDDHHQADEQRRPAVVAEAAELLRQFHLSHSFLNRTKSDCSWSSPARPGCSASTSFPLGSCTRDKSSSAVWWSAEDRR